MFFFKKVNCFAPVSGEVISLEEVDDPVFSNKLMGDGLAIIPKNNEICSPIKGKIKLLFRTHHAFVVTSENGTEIMIHIGINTVECNGKGFKALKNQDELVKVGEPIVEIDFNELSDKDLVTMMIVIDNEKKKTNLKMDEKYAEVGKTLLMKVQG